MTGVQQFVSHAEGLTMPGSKPLVLCYLRVTMGSQEVARWRSRLCRFGTIVAFLFGPQTAARADSPWRGRALVSLPLITSWIATTVSTITAAGAMSHGARVIAAMPAAS